MITTSKQLRGFFSIIVICLLMSLFVISCGSSGGSINSAQDIVQQNGGAITSDDDLQFISLDETEQIIADHGIDESPAILPAPSADYAFLRVQRDFRKCVSPLCGGFFVTALIKRELQCIDGTKSES
jgi:hypothetical protein